tara:strand:+ start:1720 stop:2826 length:1107 start_codon:yes stop_codon:yes gene_type:complete
MAFTSSYTPGLIQQSEYIYGTPDVLLPGNISGTTATFTNVTASANISASADITSRFVFVDSYIKNNSNNNTLFGFSAANTIDFNTNSAVRLRITDTGANFNSGHITASGNISSSGNVIASNVFLPSNGIISFDDSLNGTDQFIKGVDNQLTIDGDNFVLVKSDKYTRFLDDSDVSHFEIQHESGSIVTDYNITASANISASGTVFAEKSLSGAGALPNATFALAGGSTSAINISMAVSSSIGQVLTGQPTGEDINAGQLLYQRSNNRWYLADADATSTSINLLGIALNSVTAGNIIDVLIDGVVTILSPYINALAIGEPLYVDTTAGSITNTAPSGENDVVRIVGHHISSGTGFNTITFKPDGTWIEL